MISFVRQKLINYCHTYKIQRQPCASLALRVGRHCLCIIKLMLSQLSCCRNIIAMSLVFSICSYSLSAQAITISTQAMLWMQNNYGSTGIARLDAWKNLINDNKNQPELFKLRLVTDFFAQVPFKTDQEVWGKSNYWATPLEFLGKNAGDCEDFAIAKYITLRAMGVAASKLRIVYVVSQYLAQAHMVLAYYETTNANPLILDNLTGKILYASERPDLKPVYMFSENDVWMANNTAAPKQLAPGGRIASWVEVINRLNAEGLTEENLQ